jgi:hypothetical protein
MYLGLDMAWKERIPQLIVESDSKILIDIVTNNYKFSGVVPTLVQRIRNLLALDWRVQFRHTWREDNRCADWLANFSLSLDSLVKIWTRIQSKFIHWFPCFSSPCISFPKIRVYC